ncbi:bifunctional acetaldehyde-CoA/alcohol dehydrogenase [Clostridium beijerinckii]|jgi:acetaldehyde dehydrogenase (EC 1.2.1.10)/alcohol dehydrogenase AdhE (EC 1.1.1.1)|uniref:Aldehyde-alcohol dehydrogenase n=2 Tax=Clostridium beijerinckii TaxID=1520 RepID=A0AAE2RQM7_CLOBE|nr:bifunctional acetaldehyde-CoA/alcohol dehydrogenase [Clostridium beijerinckii]ABR32493.1 iron-containing alcohol dehydrogenase [Clostridium beijerinckii NCIMB 8052]AIU02688.1 bifunctional acetaldehyde-CoA/alcohol dehydrogenase [Clostridium beijerinckii ATCC 35702]MBF7807828.1 bifunctional acetaldehyde-CoA/alcohol dehydrogenase [Clostridium beijerinckii]NRT26277.1 acetaldehyde dehydrogenase/alcohol dehydrogenase [Clostridium beijerinckii]NRT66117.1 acetaldehyde dehydrogenase/alcohol dehydrog
MRVTNPEELTKRIEQIREAQREFAKFSQEEVDEIFRQAAMAANDARITLAKMAVEESGMGIVEDKVIKNHFAAEYIYNQYKDTKTCGVIERDEMFGITHIAEPIGVIAAIVPTTNPTSTAIFKTLIALKTRNGIIISPHPRAKNSTIAAAKIVLEAAERAGAPKGIIGWIDEPSIELSRNVMAESDIILATGGPGMVRAAYSSGKPAIGVGAGNTPAIIDDTAHIKMAVNSILLSKTFDNGVVCASEQSIIAMESVYDEVLKELDERGAYILRGEEIDKVRSIILDSKGSLNSEIVGQSAYKIAKMAGVEISEAVKVLIGEVESPELEEPFSHEKLSPILGMYKAKTFDDALRLASRMIELGGFGHTSILYTNQMESVDRIEKFGVAMKTARTLINMPASQGAIGDIYNFKLAPSLTLGCGSWGGNSISENVGPKHLINVKRIAERRENMLWFRVPDKIYFKFGCLPVALEELNAMKKKRAFIVTDRVLFDLGYTHKITNILSENHIEYKIFSDVEPDPTLKAAKLGADAMRDFNPDVIIAIGGGSPMDAAKIMWVMYEHPDVRFEDLAMRFMDIRKRVYEFPPMGEKAILVAIPTSAGTGSEVTPFAVITDQQTGVKYPLADYALTPNMAIIDAELMMSMPKGLTAASGIDALVHAIEAYVSVLASEYTNGLALEAIRLTFKYLPDAYNGGATNIKAREKMAHASSVAGMAFANAFLGICHSMAHKLGAFHHVPHGIANALLIDEVIRFNATDAPRKQAAFPQYKYPNAGWRYARIADYLNLGGNTEEEKVELLIKAIDDLKAKVGIPKSIKEFGVSEEKFYASMDEMVEQAFDDQCTGANPRYPLMSEIKDMYIKSYNGSNK